MAVPTPLGHWTLGQPKGTSFNTDILNGYLITLDGTSGTGGVYQDTGRDGNNDAFTNEYQANNNYDAYNFTGSILSAMSGDLGTFSAWVKLSEQNAFNKWIELTYDFTGTKSQRQFVVEFETSASPYAIRLRWGSKAPLDAVFSYNNDVSAIDPSILNNNWVLFTLTWNATEGKAKLYIIDTLAAEVSITPAVTTTDFIEVDDDFYYTTAIEGIQDCTQQDIKVWDVALTQEQIGELALSTPTNTCKRTIPIRELRTMWGAIEATMPCRATIQNKNLLGYSELYTKVPVSIELTGTRQELNSSDSYVTIQNWVVTISGRYTLPSIEVSSNLRILVNDLVLQSYNYYQSPDDLSTVIECERV